MIQPLHDWLLVEVEPSKTTFGSSSIVRVVGDPVSTGKVLAVGKGRHYVDKFVPTQVKVGERVAFLTSLTETGQGKAIGHVIKDNQALIRETDILVVVEGKVEITK